MRFMIIRKADPNTEGDDKPTEALVNAMMAYNEEMIRAGVMMGGEGLQPSRKGVKVEFHRGKPRVIDGPFAEAKELIAWYTIIQVKSREEAIEWAKRWPVEDGEGEVRLELRQIYEVEDFGADVSPAIRKQEELLKEVTGKPQAGQA